MKLVRVEIRGFRSIEKLDIDLGGTGHRVLVGMNESGKSNILRALNFLSNKVGSFDKTDAKELYDGDPHIRFVFHLKQDEIEKCRDEFYKRFIPGKEEKLTSEQSIEEFFTTHAKEVLYDVRPGKNGSWILPALPKDIRLNTKWYSVDAGTVPSHYAANTSADSLYVGEKDIESYRAKTTLEKGEPPKPVEIMDIYKTLRKIIEQQVMPDGYGFPVIYWKYNAEQHDFPAAIDRNLFGQNPNNCLPLKNMFLMYGIKKEDIHTRITEAFNKGANNIRNLLNDVGKKTNQYIRNSWAEYASLEISLTPNGDNIDIGIQDSKNHYDFTQRSDGFRRLVSFLLLMSDVQEQADNEGRRLILIDEPEVGLHPSSARALRNKLIELGENNLVIYATHSISMVDSENIENNLIVTKTNENTQISVASEDETSPAENIYNAIGHSIYNDLKRMNILLEGYQDKKTLSFFMKGKPWDMYGSCHTQGVGNIDRICQVLDLADRKYFVLSDADQSAEQVRENQGTPSYWLTYKDLGSSAITIEDFYDKDFFYNIVKAQLKKNGVEDYDAISVANNDRVKALKDFVRSRFADSKQKREKVVKDIKRICAKKVTKGNVDGDKITKVLGALLVKIKVAEKK